MGKTSHRDLSLLALWLLAAVLSGCGGGGSSSGGGLGIIGTPPHITLLSPSEVMYDIPIGTVNVVGSGFTEQSQVLIDGTPAGFIVVGDSQHIEVNLPGAPAVGVHQFSVQNSTLTSNSLPFNYYYPNQAPINLFTAVPGYYGSSALNPTPALVADFNGDGRADVIVRTDPIGSDSQASSLLLGQADGSLSAPRYLSNISAIAAGDVDGNGTVDLVGFVSATGGFACNVYLNEGKANFTAGPACPSVDVGELQVQLVDMNGDGLLDMVIVGQYAPVMVSLNLGGANFGPPQTLANTGNNSSLAVGDFSGHGLPDIAYNAVNATSGAEEIHILVNQGSGIFLDTKPSSLQGASGQVFSGDLNLDGKADLVVQPSTSTLPVKVQVFLSQGNNVFSLASETDLYPTIAAQFQFVVGDFDHDGFPDLAGENGNSQPAQMLFLWGNGQGQFTPQYAVGTWGAETVGDINGDGLPDIVTSTVNETDVVLGRRDRNYPSLTFLSPAPGPYISIADVNGDGLPDIMVGNSIFLNTGNESFGPATVVTNEAWVIADLNHDGLADLVGGSGSDVLIWPGTGNPSFPGSPITYAPPHQVTLSEVQLVDMDGDGYPDLLSSGIILYGDKQYNFTPVLFAFTAPFVIGDFNSDGYLDIVTSSQTWLGGPNRTFTPVTNHIGLPQALSGTGQEGVVADFNKDGCLDIALPNGTMWYGTCTGDFYYQGEFTGEQFIYGMVAGDFNHDGLPDIAAGLQGTTNIVLFINDGNGGFERSFYASGANVINLAGADLDKDGKLDLVISNYVTDVVTPNALVMFGR